MLTIRAASTKLPLPRAKNDNGIETTERSQTKEKERREKLENVTIGEYRPSPAGKSKPWTSKKDQVKKTFDMWLETQGPCLGKKVSCGFILRVRRVSCSCAKMIQRVSKGREANKLTYRHSRPVREAMSTLKPVAFNELCRESEKERYSERPHRQTDRQTDTHTHTHLKERHTERHSEK